MKAKSRAHKFKRGSEQKGKGKMSLKRRMDKKKKTVWQPTEGSRPTKKLKPWEKVSANREKVQMPDSKAMQKSLDNEKVKIPKSMRPFMRWMETSKKMKEEKKAAEEEAAKAKAEATQPKTKRVIIRKVKRKKKTEDNEEQPDSNTIKRPKTVHKEDDGVQRLSEGKNSNLRGSYTALQRGIAEDSDEEISDTEKEFTKATPVKFGEQAQMPPKLTIPKDKRSLMPAHIKKKKMQELIQRVSEGGPAELPAPELLEAGERCAGSFEAMQKAARDQYAKYKEKQRAERIKQLAPERKQTRSEKRRSNALCRAAEVQDF
eukprot:TRINITY_DN34303_c0_g1_i1.p1 TRINITY_DN34303_c0_g1~~TRINITY_DN34303_c0_g1_i1.p1  ORF type:complete len:317 (+),score=84.39 TRINITY_DN34303_c0_g1_i1:68-1018(+)